MIFVVIGVPGPKKKTEDKTVVRYKPSDKDFIMEGLPALIFNGAIDHPNPKLNEGVPVETSIVVKVGPKHFETLNTIYRRTTAD